MNSVRMRPRRTGSKRSWPGPAWRRARRGGHARRCAGAYTHIPQGGSPADADLLGEPVGGRLLFAGEHTQSAQLAYADGAMTSGIREAKRLLRQPSVHLGPVVCGRIRSE